MITYRWHSKDSNHYIDISFDLNGNSTHLQVKNGRKQAWTETRKYSSHLYKDKGWGREEKISPMTLFDLNAYKIT